MSDLDVWGTARLVISSATILSSTVSATSAKPNSLGCSRACACLSPRIGAAPEKGRGRPFFGANAR